jgi:hypothetical protein
MIGTVDHDKWYQCYMGTHGQQAEELPHASARLLRTRLTISA